MPVSSLNDDYINKNGERSKKQNFLLVQDSKLKISGFLTKKNHLSDI